MTSPIAIFGTTTEQFTREVIVLRKAIHANGFDEKSDQLLTIPHLTLCVNQNFDSKDFPDVQDVLSKTLAKERGFSITIKEFIVMDHNIAASFDNTKTSEFAKKVTSKLTEFGFKLVETDHMRLIRSEVKPEYVDKVRKLAEQAMPKEIKIEGVAIAGNLLRKQDILWETKLHE